MSKKIYIQILITGVILLIIFFVYLVYFKNIDNKLVENEDKSSAKVLLESSDDLIKEMSYYSEDNKGNKYEIKSEYGFINPEKTNLILMDNVKAVIYLANGEKIYIGSDKAEYNNNNNDTAFNGSVKMNYNEHKITSENLNLSFQDKVVTLNNNVNYISNISNLEADKISIDFLNKNTKIQMNDEYRNVLVKSISKNGDN
tara:strand:+ start:146 stop:745 length:600 start_codon:yes stop_codon:yes gene_type:complete